MHKNIREPRYQSAGVVVHFNELKGYGFLTRSALGACAGQIFFHISACDVKTPYPAQGERVTFVETVGPKGAVAASVARCIGAPVSPTDDVRTPEHTELTEAAFVHGVVTLYRLEGGFGGIAALDSPSSADLYFSISACDIKRPPPTLGERVLMTRIIGPKGPTAAVVRRVSIQPETNPLLAKFKPKSKPKLKPMDTTSPAAQQGQVPTATTKSELSEKALLTALTRAMRMVVGAGTPSPRAAPMHPRPQHQLPPSPSPQSSSATLLLPEQYQNMVVMLSTGQDYELLLPPALAMLARTQPEQARYIASLDAESQRLALVASLENELDATQHRALRDHAEYEWATKLDFGYIAPPSPVAVAPRVPTPPPRTIHCGVCMDDHAIEDVFLVTGCDHAYCRDSMRTYVLGKLETQDVSPSCPHDGCETVLSDADLTSVLTADEQQQYYDTCLNLAVGTIPGVFKCLRDDCRGVAALGNDDPHFVCPLCRTERCVACNTREWHDGLTCEQHRQRVQDSTLHPEQLRSIYGGNARVYQCRRCGFGPIEHRNCDSLTTHHNEGVGSTARINNACPRCAWFANTISEWPRWNGQLQSMPPQ